MSALVVRSRAALRVSPIGKRFASGHGEYKHWPFNEKEAITHPKRFAARTTVFLSTAFSIPFAAIYFRWHKPGGLKNP